MFYIPHPNLYLNITNVYIQYKVTVYTRYKH
jgi:hypothetical protein